MSKVENGIGSSAFCSIGRSGLRVIAQFYVHNHLIISIFLSASVYLSTSFYFCPIPVILSTSFVVVFFAFLPSFHPLLRVLTRYEERRGNEEERNKRRGSVSRKFSPKSLAIRDILQRRMMGNYTGMEICFSNLASPPSPCLFFQGL